MARTNVATAGGTLIGGSLSANASPPFGPSGLVAVDFIGKSPTISSPTPGINDTIILSDRVIDDGLRVLPIEADSIYICSGYPGTFIDAETLAVGFKSFGAGGCFGATTTAPTGLKVATTPITDGLIMNNNVATHWAAVDTSTNRLLITHPLDAPVVTVANSPFTLPSFEITFTGQ